MKIASSTEIENTPGEVFKWLENPEKAKAWMSSVTKTEILHETANRIGTTFQETVEDAEGKMEMQGSITNFSENKLIAFHLESKVNTVDVEYTLEEIDAGVRLRYDADIRWKFPVNIMSVFIGWKIKQKIIAQLAGELNTLKLLCE
ncbi:MAG: DUF3284 domain-containing protein [Anaerolineae bacterium]|jgi:uncharacterized protein YndB with AHSA1/START domain|nr:DUF3284 domain-containing protein [Anaerolineae bacterium]MBT7070703.1 DUF3284 domain-containing protein [Anaerolineae bacterium]MBT7323901.1 DUF3284 domain-containing protein [Anaerolineae bacterium]